MSNVCVKSVSRILPTFADIHVNRQWRKRIRQITKRQRFYWCFYSYLLPSSNITYTQRERARETHTQIKCQHLPTINSCNYFAFVWYGIGYTIPINHLRLLIIVGRFHWVGFSEHTIYCMSTANYRNKNVFVSMIIEGRCSSWKLSAPCWER